MTGKHPSSLPEEIRASLKDEPRDRRRQIEKVWRVLGDVQDRTAVKPSADQAWADLRSGLSSSPSPHQRATARSPVRRNRRVAAAAATLAVAVIAGLLWFQRPVTIEVPPGEQRSVTLPDGSVVALNSETSLRFATGFRSFPAGTRRHVELTGEAYFQVVAADEPFRVETREAHVDVLGTEFNVRSRPGEAENGTVVTLAEGRVRVTARRAAETAVTLLKPGESTEIAAASAPPTPPRDEASLDRILAWRQQGFAVVDRPLGAVLDEVERRYAVLVQPRQGVDLSASMSLFYLRGAHPDQILRDICLAQGCAYRETSRGFALAPGEVAPETESNGNGTDASTEIATRP